MDSYIWFVGKQTASDVIHFYDDNKVQCIQITERKKLSLIFHTVHSFLEDLEKNGTEISHFDFIVVRPSDDERDLHLDNEVGKIPEKYLAFHGSSSSKSNQRTKVRFLNFVGC